jgi:hypothetical protein
MGDAAGVVMVLTDPAYPDVAPPVCGREVGDPVPVRRDQRAGKGGISEKLLGLESAWAAIGAGHTMCSSGRGHERPHPTLCPKGTVKVPLPNLRPTCDDGNMVKLPRIR